MQAGAGSCSAKAGMQAVALQARPERAVQNPKEATSTASRPREYSTKPKRSHQHCKPAPRAQCKTQNKGNDNASINKECNTRPEKGGKIYVSYDNQGRTAKKRTGYSQIN